MAFSISNGIKSLEDGKILVIEPYGAEPSSPLFCPICAFPMKTIEDSISYRSFKCCNKCEMRWSTSNKGSLKEGWKPDQTSQEWCEYIEERKLLNKILINIY